jgi:isoaspartyl peptidase/L-asparaginase-like protein (Ntn-hydrolase superfamily)
LSHSRTLVSSGATAFAKRYTASTVQRAIELVDHPEMISPSAWRDWDKWKARLEASNYERTPYKQPMQEDTQSLRVKQDTVGAVAMDCGGSLAAGVSRLVLL